jgi:hypothetical protein
MKRAANWMLLSALCVVLLAGCSKKNSQTSGQAATTGDPAVAATNDPGVSAAPARLKAPDGLTAGPATVQVSGKLGCGHCTFHVKDECSLAMKSDDGTVYLLNAGDRQEELMEKRYDQLPIRVAGRVAEVDGQKVIYTETLDLR